MTRVGTQLGPYKLEAAIGAGGMGEVFRASDTRLHRTVAIKILSQNEVADPERKRRFLQEARAASALNHPNIVTLHDIANDGGVDYLVMEYVSGQSLDKLIKPKKGVPLPDAINYTAQIASALAAAHAAGIVHRDIKPANVIIVGESQVKVLDFGLAKLLETSDAAETVTTGVIMGTVAYMSPEQASGKQVDHRTDIFSAGVVLYELITGELPFIRRSSAETMSAIINDPYPPTTTAPTRISEILDKALEKDPKERYQTAADLAVDLRRAQKNVPLAAAPSVTAPAAGLGNRSLLWIAITLVVVAAAAGVVWFTRGKTDARNDLLVDAQFTRLTDFPGDEYSAGISPDGKFVVFVSDRDGPADLWLTQVGTGQFQNLTKGTYIVGTGNRDTGFSPDGSEIWHRGPPPGGPPPAPSQRMRRMPLVGGSWRPFLTESTVNVTWSPDGKRIAYFNFNNGDPMFVADADGGNPKQIFIDRAGIHNHFPTWSADGKWIYFTHGNAQTGEMDLWRIAPDGGSPEAVKKASRSIGYITPLDSNTVLYVAEAEDWSGPWLWAFDLDRKLARRISSGVERYTSIAATADGRRLVASVSNPAANLWTVPILDHPIEEGDVKPFPVPNVRALAPRFTGDSLLYLSSQSGGDGLWRFQNGHSDEIWKGSEGALFQPSASSQDGRQLVVVFRRDGKQTLRLIAADGSNSRSLAPAIDSRGTPGWSPDGKWIVTGGTDSKGAGLFKVPVDGGEPVRLITGQALNPVWSPDATLIVFSGTNASGSEPLRAMQPDGTPIDLPAIRVSPNGERFRFMPDGKSLVYMQGTFRGQDFWLLDLATKKSRPLTHLNNSAVMRTFDITPDGKQIVFDRLHENSDIVLIDLKKTP